MNFDQLSSHLLLELCEIRSARNDARRLWVLWRSAQGGCAFHVVL